MIELDNFVTQYLVTALWSSTDNERPLDEDYSIEDVADESLQSAIADCNSFRELAGNYLDNLNETQVAHDFWLTRNHHGAGFWDGDYKKDTGEFLTKLSHSFGELNPYVGDDGYIYL